MKLKQFVRNVMTSGGEKSDFTANMNGAAFAILSSSIYEHKIAAVVREICCNAYDSHIEAGREHVPFKVSLPNTFSPTLVISDSGIGMDDKAVRETFAVYFGSPKNEGDFSNEVTGGFGIGGKVPFSYTDAFEIVARKDGVERMYAAYIGEDGIPCVQQIHERNVDERNGVDIRIPVKQNDFRKFAYEAEIVCSLFPVKPEVRGQEGFKFGIEDIYGQIRDKGFAVMNRANSSSLYTWNDYYVLMGNVLYAVPDNIIEDVVDYSERVFLRQIAGNESMIVEFGIGEQFPAASRERLSLNDPKKELIAERFVAVLNEAKKEIQQEVDAAETVYDALVVVDKWIPNRTTTKYNMFKYRGVTLHKTINNNVKLPNTDVRLIRRAYTSGNMKKEFAGHHLRVEEIRGAESIDVFYNDDDSKPSTVTINVNRYFKKFGLGHQRRHFMVITEKPSELRLDRVNRLLNGKANLISISEVKRLTHDVRTSGKRVATSEKSDNTVFGITRTRLGIWSADNVEVSPETCCRISKEVIGDAMDPETLEGSDYFYVVENGNNKAKLDRLGIPSYHDKMDKWITDRPKLGKAMAVIQNNPASHSAVVRNIFRFSSIDAAVELRKASDELSEVSLPPMDTTSRLVIMNSDEFIEMNEWLDEKIGELRAYANKSSPVIEVLSSYGVCKKSLVQMLDFCVENGFNFNSSN